MLHPISVLVVDDQPRNVVALEAALASVDFNVVTAHSGREALRLVLAQDFAVIVLDVHMPEMDGFETAGLIRARERSRSTPIVFLTADDRDAARLQEGYRLGAVDFLHKPFNSAILRAKLTVFVELFRRTYELLAQTIALEERTAELTRVTADLGRREQQVVALNTDLERRVVERTAALGAAIADLEAEAAERQRAEGTLQASEERFRSQYKGFPLPTYTWLHVGDDFVMQDFNDAAEAIDGGDVSAWVGQRASARYADVPVILSDLRVCLSEQRSVRRELRFRYPVSGRERDLALSYVFVPPSTIMLHTEDITDAVRAEQQREGMARSEKLRALGQMASGIAHDLNQSLMLVATYSDLARQALMHDPPDLAELENLMATTTQAAMDGGESVKRLLLFTRSAPERHSMLVDLGAMVRESAQLTAPRWRDAVQAEGRPITLGIESEGDPVVQGSPSQLREMMTNLIFNAVDALPNGGTIRVRVIAEHGEGIIEVADSGIGMSAEVRERVFDPFFTTKPESGTGLGLAMVFGIVEQHGGHIDVQSEESVGTIFRIAMPLVVDTLPEAAPRLNVPDQSGPRRALRVLAVDDEPMMTKAVARMLKPAGHVVTMAASGEEAVERLGEQVYDVVVSDMGMGAGMTGLELAEIVKLRWPRVRFLLATGWGAAIDPSEARTRGVEAVLSKPYYPADLLRLLATGGGDVAAPSSNDTAPDVEPAAATHSGSARSSGSAGSP